MVHVHENVTWWRMYKTKAPSDDSLLCVVVVYLRKEHPSGNVGSYDLGGEGIHGSEAELVWSSSAGGLHCGPVVGIPRDPVHPKGPCTQSFAGDAVTLGPEHGRVGRNRPAAL